jgi:phosphoglucosamine mutase
MTDENGRIIDGDKILAVCGRQMKNGGRLAGDTIVATVMSNLGFHVYAEQNGIKVIKAPVGDRNVLAEMQKGGYVIGGTVRTCDFP